MTIELGPGSIVRTAGPYLPPVYVAPPESGSAIVVPVPGPQGPPGAGGDPEAVQDMIDMSVALHVNAPEPHPAYDDIPSLVLLFENGLV